MWRMMRRLLRLWLWVLVDLPVFCSLEVFHCSVTQTSTGTLYSVPEFFGSYCHYSWIRDGIVIANNIEKQNKQVITSSNRTLQTRQCYEEINLTWDCFSGTEHNASCLTDCSENAGIQEIKDNPARYWIIAVVVITILLAVIGIGLGIKHRRNICSWSRKLVYNLVNRQDHQPNEDDIEKERG